MDNFNVEVLKAVNGVAFGTGRSDVRNAFGTGYKTFKKSRFSANTADDYGGFHVFYDKDDKAEAIEIFACGTLTIDGKAYSLTTEDLQKAADDFVHDETGFISKSKSIGVYAPEGKVESVLFAGALYYR